MPVPQEPGIQMDVIPLNPSKMIGFYGIMIVS